MKEAIIVFIKNKIDILVDSIIQDKRENRAHVKQKIWAAIEEARNELAELRANEFKMMHGKRWLTRMNALVEKLSLADPELGSLVWNLFNAPVRIESMRAIQQYNINYQDSEAEFEIMTLKQKYLDDIKYAMKRFNELEKNPLSGK